MTPEHRKHLALLADALEKRAPALFDMSVYASSKEGRLFCTPNEVAEHPCGTICCALGTAAFVEGIPKPRPGESWNDYSERIFGTHNMSNEEWDFLFDSNWCLFPNHKAPADAAKRIRHYLETNEAPSIEEWIGRNSNED